MASTCCNISRSIKRRKIAYIVSWESKVTLRSRTTSTRYDHCQLVVRDCYLVSFSLPKSVIWPEPNYDPYGWRLTWLTCASSHSRFRGPWCIPVSSVVGKWQLWSADSGTLVVPRTRTTIGRRDFAVSGRPHGTASTSNCGLHHCLPRRLKKSQKSFIWLLVPLKTFV